MLEPFKMPYKPNKYVDILKGINDEPPSLYALMNSKINYNNPNPVSIENLPSAFKSYLFDFDYPLNASLKDNFEETFLTHYMFRRIGYDTYLSFKLHLKVKMQEIMPKYSKMFEGFGSLDFLGIKETHIKNANDTKEREETTNTNTTSSASDVVNATVTTDNRYSELPQSEILDPTTSSYMTDYTLNTVTTDSSTNTNGNIINNETKNDNTTANKYESLVIDKVDTIDEYEKFIKFANNIYELIFKECDCLFFGLI